MFDEHSRSVSCRVSTRSAPLSPAQPRSTPLTSVMAFLHILLTCMACVSVCRGDVTQKILGTVIDKLHAHKHKSTTPGPQQLLSQYQGQLQYGSAQYQGQGQYQAAGGAAQHQGQGQHQAAGGSAQYQGQGQHQAAGGSTQYQGQGLYVPSTIPSQSQGQGQYIPSTNPGQNQGQGQYIPSTNPGQNQGQGQYIPSTNPGQNQGQGQYVYNPVHFQVQQTSTRPQSEVPLCVCRPWNTESSTSVAENQSKAPPTIS